MLQPRLICALDLDSFRLIEPDTPTLALVDLAHTASQILTSDLARIGGGELTEHLLVPAALRRYRSKHVPDVSGAGPDIDNEDLQNVALDPLLHFGAGQPSPQLMTQPRTGNSHHPPDRIRAATSIESPGRPRQP